MRLYFLKLTVGLTARVCRSVLKTSVEELTLDSCVVGGTYVKSFTIENCSEMPLSFDITTHQVYTGEAVDNYLEFTDHDSGSLGIYCYIPL